MSSKPLAPSKDALRTLRFLAHSPSAALVGTASAFCGVATIHYHERRKVHRAEEILKTKRKLHSISNGRGSARLACMFEAAERGDDFTIRKSKPAVHLRRRHHSTLAAQQDLEDGIEWKPFAHVSETQKSEPRAKHSDDAMLEPEHDQVSLKSFTRNPPEHTRRPRVEDLKTGEEHSPIAVIYKASSKPNKPSMVRVATDWSRVRQASALDLRKYRGSLENTTERTTDSRPLTPPVELSNDQAMTDLNPIAAGSTQLLTNSSSNATTNHSDDSNPIILNLNPLSTSVGNAFDSLQPWQVAQDSERPDEVVREQPIDYRGPDVNLYLDSSEQIPAAKQENLSRSRYDLSNPKIRQGLSVIGADRYAYVFSSFISFQQEHGRAEALLLLERTMERFTVTDKRPDFALAQALFLDCTRLFSASELKPLVWRYVEKFLHGDMPRLEVVRFLYPRCGAGHQSSEQHYYFLAHQYLDAMRTQGYDLNRQVTELRKVLVGSRMCNIALHEHLVVPALRSLCAVGRMTSAQALIDEVVSAHHVEATFYTLQILIKGYARAGNWSKVKSILDKCHSEILSQHKAYGSSSLLVSIINDYSLTQSVENVVRFTMHCIQTYGIQPISAMTRQIVTLCLRHRRYDLAVNWIDMVREDFPHIDVGIGSSTFAFDVSCVWRDIDASCEDILAGCRALATGTIRDPFSAVLRSSISEAAARYINPRLEELRQVLGTEVPEQAVGQIHDFHTTLKALKDNAATNRQGSRARLLLADLLSQGRALRGLNAVCRGHVDSYGVGSRSMSLQTNNHNVAPKLPLLPPLPDLQDTLMQGYAQRNREGREVEHETLQKTAAQLVQQDRRHDAFELIQTVYGSRWAQSSTGHEFSLDLFTDWLRLASDLKSGAKLRAVLWAIVDADPTLKLNSHIILLARIAAPKTHLQRAKTARKNEVDEVEYLRIRLKRRRWMGEKGTKGLVFEDWQGFGKAL